MKKLLILGGSRYVIPAIKAAKKLGVYVITCDYLPDNVGHKYSDEYHNVSIINKEAVLKLAQSLNVDGIISFATDPGVVVAAYVAEKLGLPTPPYKSVEILQNKNLFRNFLEKNGFNVPKHKSFEKSDNVFEGLKEFSFPFIVKPVDSAGSKGVTRVDDESQIKIALDKAFEHSFNGRIIVEEFIKQKGCSSDTDCFSFNNKMVFTSFNRQYFDQKADNPYTPAYYIWPSDMSDEKQFELKKELNRLINLLNMGTSIYNIETRVGINNKAYIMEVSPRAGGNRLSEILGMATGQDLIINNIKAALGMNLEELSNPNYDGYWAEYVIHSDKNGVFSDLFIDNSIVGKYLLEKDLWVKAEDIVHSFSGANDTIGTLIFKFDDIKIAEDILNNHENWLKINLK